MINWRSRKTRNNTQFTSIATVEGKTDYVLGHHLNFEPDVEQVAVDGLAKVHGDLMAGSRTAFHAQAQYWKSDEFAEHAFSRGFRFGQIRMKNHCSLRT